MLGSRGAAGPRSAPPVASDYVRLPAEALARFDGTHVGALEPEPLRAALAASVRALLEEGGHAALPAAAVVAERLAEL